MARRHNPEWDKHLSGVAATFDGPCARCPEPILVGQRVVKIRGGWIHLADASGWDE